MSRSLALAPSERPSCAFCPRVATDAVDLDGERAVPVCAVCGGLRVGRGLATPAVSPAAPAVSPAAPAAPVRPRVTRTVTVRATATAAPRWTPGSGEPFSVYRPLGGRGRR